MTELPSSKPSSSKPSLRPTSTLKLRSTGRRNQRSATMISPPATATGALSDNRGSALLLMSSPRSPHLSDEDSKQIDKLSERSILLPPTTQDESVRRASAQYYQAILERGETFLLHFDKRDPDGE